MRNRNLLLCALLFCLGVGTSAQDKVAYAYTEASELTLIGKIIENTSNPYHRVDTAIYKGFTPSENKQVRMSSGIAVVFRTDSPSIVVKTAYGHTISPNNTNGFSARGYDLYIRKDGQWLFAGAGTNDPNRPDKGLVIAANMGRDSKECLMYLPLYSEVNSVRIGVEEGSVIEPLDNPFSYRIAVFGSSYTQGSCTSRSGMSYLAQLSRRTGLHFMSLGCGGNCRLQSYFADVLCDARADAFLFDTFSNSSPGQIRERLFPFIEKIQKAHPGKPLVFQRTIRRESRNFDAKARKWEETRAAVADSMMTLAMARYKDVYFITPNATSPTHDATVDGVHPDNYGYTLWAESIAEPLCEILKSHGMKLCEEEFTVNVIPCPASVEVSDGKVDVAGARCKIDSKFGKAAVAAVKDFEKKLLSASAVRKNSAGVSFLFEKSPEMSDEEYTISVRDKEVSVKASSLKGVIYAVETLKQMLPVEVYTGVPAPEADWSLPCVEIQDKPRFSYRGLHLDVSRHFFDVEQVKRYLDLMALHKLNTFHWHLTDDQGWRIEIKKYPELTQKGAVRRETIIGRWADKKGYDGTPYGEGMWYSHEQVKEVLDYAAARGIEVIPEIDLPGHMLAALATYPELGCTGGPYEVCRWWGVSKDVLCVGKESTLEFLENVLSEVCELFPSKYIHIGGDECPKVRWQGCPHCQAKIRELGYRDDINHTAEHYLQSYVTKRMEDFLATKGKKIIGWDEILEGEVAPDATVMSWRGTKGGMKSASLGHDVIMAPNTFCYFNYYQAKDQSKEPLARGGFTPVSKVYSYEPLSDEMSDEEKSHILGVQACMWSEYITDKAGLEYMLLPRLSALSEVQWAEPENKDYQSFLKKMRHMAEIYEALGCNYAKHIFKL